MRCPFFGGDRGDRPISINLPADISPGFAVFFRAGDGSPPGADGLPGVVKSWAGLVEIASGHRSALVTPWRRPPHRPLSVTAVTRPSGTLSPRGGEGQEKNRASKPG